MFSILSKSVQLKKIVQHPYNTYITHELEWWCDEEGNKYNLNDKRFFEKSNYQVGETIWKNLTTKTLSACPR
jgi:hypothetical protein